MLRRIANHIVVRNAFVLFVVQFSSYLLPLITLPYLARVLSPEKLGLLAFAQNFIWYFVTLTEYGFNLTATRKIAISRDDPAVVSRIFSSVLAAKTLLTVLGFGILAAALILTPRLRANSVLFLVCFLAVGGNLLFPVWLFQGLQKMGHLAVRDVGAKLLALALLFFLVHGDSDYVLAAGVQSFAQLLAGIVGLVAVYAITPVRFSFPPWRDIAAALGEGWPVFLSVAALTFYGVTNVVILGLRAPAEQVAYYNNAFRLIVAVRMLVSPIGTALYPHISQMAAASRVNAARFLRRYSLLLSVPFLLISTCIFVTAPWLVRIIYGPGYEPTVLILQILSFSPFLMAFAHTYSTNFMLAFGYEKQWMRIVLLCTAVNFAVLFPLMSIMTPAVAVAVTGMATDVFAAAAYYAFYRKHARVTETVAVP